MTEASDDAGLNVEIRLFESQESWRVALTRTSLADPGPPARSESIRPRPRLLDIAIRARRNQIQDFIAPHYPQEPRSFQGRASAIRMNTNSIANAVAF
jgi:hypothetical protein